VEGGTKKGRTAEGGQTWMNGVVRAVNWERGEERRFFILSKERGPLGTVRREIGVNPG